MTSIFETPKGAYQIKENIKSWSIKLLSSNKLECFINLKKSDYSTIDKVKEFILNEIE